MPEKLSRFGIVCARFDEYIIILGGSYDYNASITMDNKYSDNIFIYDIKFNTFRKSKVKLPKSDLDRCNAVITNNKCNDELLTFGFIRICYKSNTFIKLQYLPVYLIQLIGKWVCYQNIHIIADNGEHWKINVDCIIASAH
eukprot:306772_1